MSGAEADEVVRSAVPVADLTIIDQSLGAGLERLREAVQKVRPADVGRDPSHRKLEQGRLLVEASDDRRAAAMLRAAHPAVAAITTLVDASGLFIYLTIAHVMVAQLHG